MAQSKYIVDLSIKNGGFSSSQSVSLPECKWDSKPTWNWGTTFVSAAPKVHWLISMDLRSYELKNGLKISSLPDFQRKYHFWLVVDLPLWKIWVRQLGLFFPTEWKVIKFHGSSHHQPSIGISTYIYQKPINFRNITGYIPISPDSIYNQPLSSPWVPRARLVQPLEELWLLRHAYGPWRFLALY